MVLLYQLIIKNSYRLTVDGYMLQEVYNFFDKIIKKYIVFFMQFAIVSLF
jgi:hypothetical protein